MPTVAKFQGFALAKFQTMFLKHQYKTVKLKALKLVGEVRVNFFKTSPLCRVRLSFIKFFLQIFKMKYLALSKVLY
ncbi:hypothetical protein HMPREF9554_00142 [Treponema phagedenis F0421]|nr:hypothetical protein HMPREF9554_00142 [Treponema phagedenis F0421]